MKQTAIKIVMGVLCPIIKSLLITFFIAILLILILTANSTSAQEAVPAPVKVGQRIPENFWNLSLIDISGKQDKLIHMNNYAGKPIIIDFYASWCVPCLSNMPKLDSLSRINGSSFQSIVANTRSRIDSLKDMRGFIAGYLKDKKSFSSPIVLFNANLVAYFPHHVVPHYLWIGADGYLKAVTGHKEITASNIKRFVAGKELILTQKTN